MTYWRRWYETLARRAFRSERPASLGEGKPPTDGAGGGEASFVP